MESRKIETELALIAATEQGRAAVQGSELLARDFTGKTVVIIGCPASGKTTLGKALAKRTGAKLIHTDDYIQSGVKDGYKEALYVMLPDILAANEPLIIEGVQGYRLLRKGVELDCFYPDVVIELKVTPEQVALVYKGERSLDKRQSVDKTLKSLSAFNKMHQTILEKYQAMDNPNPPEWITVENKF